MGVERAVSVLMTLARLATASLLWSATSAPAQPPPRQLDSCTACHGPGGNAQIPSFPSLAGQPQLFIENQLVIIREGLRDIPSMTEVMKGMSDEHIIALARHFAAQPLHQNTAPLRAQAYRVGAQLSGQLLCGTCHLPNYAGQQQVPRLAGQNEAYLLQSMKEFRDKPGPGRDTIMAATLRGLADTDLAHLAHYLAPGTVQAGALRPCTGAIAAAAASGHQVPRPHRPQQRRATPCSLLARLGQFPNLGAACKAGG